MPVNLLDPRQTPEPLERKKMSMIDGLELDELYEDRKQLQATRSLLNDALQQIQNDSERLLYIARYWESQVFGETLGGLYGAAFIKALDRLMADYPQID